MSEPLPTITTCQSFRGVAAASSLAATALIGSPLLTAVTAGITPTNANCESSETRLVMSEPPPSLSWGLTTRPSCLK